MTSTERLALALASQLLEYPDQDYYTSLSGIRDGVAVLEQSPQALAIGRFLSEMETQGQHLACQNYVAVFDLDPAASLYMTWHRYGNDRSQGQAMAALNGLYRSAGLEPVAGVMPDYLPRMMEFLSICEDWAAEAMLDGFGPELSALIKHLQELDLCHAPMLTAVFEPLRQKWPRHFEPRTRPDTTARPMARPTPEYAPMQHVSRKSGSESLAQMQEKQD